MTRKNFFYIQVCSVFFTFLFSCNNTDHKFNPNNHTESIAKGAKKYTFKLSLSPRDKYYYTISNNSKTVFEIDSKKETVTNNMVVGLSYEILDDSAGYITMRIKYEKIHIVAKNKDNEEQVLDADNKSDDYDLMQQILGYIKGAPLIVQFDDKANIIKIKGSKELSDKITATLESNGSNDLETKNKVQELLKQLTGEGFLSGNVSQGFKILPDTALYIGDSWQKKTTESSSIDFETNTRYILQSINDGNVTVSVDGSIENNKKGTTSMMGREVSTNFKGKQTGEIVANENTGMLHSAQTTTVIEGDIQVLTRTVPITITLDKKISVKKL